MRKSFLFLFLLVVSTTAQAPAPPDRDNKIYYGQGYGAVGISSVLLEYYIQSGDEEVYTLINETTNKVIEDSFNFTWGRIVDDEIMWTGFKYGQEGIFDYFMKLYDQKNETLYLDIMKHIVNTRIVQVENQINKTYWGYEYINESTAAGISLTGRDYGASSVIENTLDLYEITGNSSLLDFAEQTASWMIGLRNESLEFPLNLTIPWYDVKGFSPIYVTSYGRGVAGIIPTFARLSDITGNNTYKEVNGDLISYLIAIQDSSGGWPIEYGSDSYEIGLDEGTAGVILSLAKYGGNSEQVIRSISAGISFIENEFEKMEVNDKIKYQYNDGIAGVISVFYSIGKENELPSRLKDEFLNNFQAIKINELEFTLYKSDSSAGVFELSYKSGLAGALKSLLLMDENSELVPKIIEAFRYFINDGLWNRQVEIANKYIVGSTEIKYDTILYSMIAFVGVLVILYWMRKRLN